MSELDDLILHFGTLETRNGTSVKTIGKNGAGLLCSLTLQIGTNFSSFAEFPKKIAKKGAFSLTE